MADTVVRIIGPKSLETSTTAQYDSTGKVAVVKEIHVSNPTTGDLTFTLSFGADAAGTRLFDGFVIPAKSIFTHECYKATKAADGANAICAHGSGAGLVLEVTAVEVT